MTVWISDSKWNWSQWPTVKWMPRATKYQEDPEERVSRQDEHLHPPHHQPMFRVRVNPNQWPATQLWSPDWGGKCKIYGSPPAFSQYQRTSQYQRKSIPIPKIGWPSSKQRRCQHLHDTRPVTLQSHVMQMFERLIFQHLRPLLSTFPDPLLFAYWPQIDGRRHHLPHIQGSVTSWECG